MHMTMRVDEEFLPYTQYARQDFGQGSLYSPIVYIERRTSSNRKRSCRSVYLVRSRRGRRWVKLHEAEVPTAWGSIAHHIKCP